MSKMKFEAPKLEIIRFEAADILTTSAEPFDGEWVPIGPQIEDENKDLFF